MKLICVFLVGILPPSLFKNIALRLLGFRIGLKTRIGISILWNLNSIELEDSSKVGNFNVVRNLKKFKLGSSSSIGNFNWITSNVEDIDRTTASLIMGRESVITSRHYIDCAGGVELKENSGLLGVRSTVMTHGVDPKYKLQKYHVLEIGRRTLIGSNSVIVPNTIIPEDCYFGMGSLIAGGSYQPGGVYLNSKATLYRKNEE